MKGGANCVLIKVISALRIIDITGENVTIKKTIFKEIINIPTMLEGDKNSKLFFYKMTMKTVKLL